MYPQISPYKLSSQSENPVASKRSKFADTPTGEGGIRKYQQRAQRNHNRIITNSNTSCNNNNNINSAGRLWIGAEILLVELSLFVFIFYMRNWTELTRASCGRLLGIRRTRVSHIFGQGLGAIYYSDYNYFFRSQFPKDRTRHRYLLVKNKSLPSLGCSDASKQN